MSDIDDDEYDDDEPRFRRGQRVRYIGIYEKWAGWAGTVTGQASRAKTGRQRVHVRFDDDPVHTRTVRADSLALATINRRTAQIPADAQRLGHDNPQQGADMRTVEITTHIVEVKGGTAGQVIINGTVVWQSKPQTDTDTTTAEHSAQELAEKRVVSAFGSLFPDDE